MLLILPSETPLKLFVKEEQTIIWKGAMRLMRMPRGFKNPKYIRER